VLASVCEPFFTTRAEGTGLGLAIAKRYIEQNGGDLGISSVAAVGTTVRIRLPAIDQPDPFVSEPEPARTGASRS
jgi:signal transduction histidine kinase